MFSDSVAIGVRGTVFSVIQDDRQARLMVTRGRVEAQGEVGDGAIVSANEFARAVRAYLGGGHQARQDCKL